MIGLNVQSKKHLKTYHLGKDISHLVIETSLFGVEYNDNVINLPYVGPDPYRNRKFFGTITVKDGILVKCS